MRVVNRGKRGGWSVLAKSSYAQYRLNPKARRAHINRLARAAPLTRAEEILAMEAYVARNGVKPWVPPDAPKWWEANQFSKYELSRFSEPDPAIPNPKRKR